MVESEDHHPMWEKLRLELRKQDEILEILPRIFKKYYIDAQKNLPDMSFFNFVVEDIHGIRIKE